MEGFGVALVRLRRVLAIVFRVGLDLKWVGARSCLVVRH